MSLWPFELQWTQHPATERDGGGLIHHQQKEGLVVLIHHQKYARNVLMGRNNEIHFLKRVHGEMSCRYSWFTMIYVVYSTNFQ